jgi:hypothetical protein
MFKTMAIIFARQAEKVLARNRFVDSTIADLLDTVPDTTLLLKAWEKWASNRQLSGVDWAVSKFEDELDGALELARDALHWETHDKKYAPPKGGAQ